MENKMPKSKHRKKASATRSRTWKEARLTKSSVLTAGTRLSEEVLTGAADLILEEVCDAVVSGEEFGTCITGLDINGRGLGFVEGPKGSGCRVYGKDTLHIVSTDGNVMDNLDVVAKLVRRLNLVALIAVGEVWLQDLAPGEVARPISRTESFGRREAVQVTFTAPSLGVSRASLAPIVRTPFGRLASADTAQHLYNEQVESTLADCFECSSGAYWAA